MRVIAGKYRGRALRTASGLDVRPTSDRLRETLFNILAPRIEGSRFLDLCAGSGAVGIEALSRGAESVTFVDRSPRACSIIDANLRALRLEGEEKERATLMRSEATAAIKRLADEADHFDLVFFDPPYASALYDQVIKQLGSGRILSPGGIVVVEHRVKSPLDERYGRLTLIRQVKQGESALSLYELS